MPMVKEPFLRLAYFFCFFGHILLEGTEIAIAIAIAALEEEEGPKCQWSKSLF